MASLTSQLIVRLVDQVSGPSRAVAVALGHLNAAQARNNARLDALRGRMVEAAAVAYGLARAVSAPLRAATEFETKLEDIAQKIDLPVAGLGDLGKELRAIARQTTQSAAEIAEGMDVLAGMGANRADSLAMLPAIGRAATAYGAQVKDLAQAGYAALDNLKVPANQFARALDAMAQAGKAGAFELKDMAQYFPTLGAGYQALGQTGVPAVADLAAALQIVRKGTGDSASAAGNLANVLQKMRAPQTVAAFKKMGVNLEKELAKAAKKGLTPIEAIAEITNKALKGDLSKIGYLFSDAEVQKGLRPLIQNIEEYRRIRAEALKAQGVVEADYKRRLQTGALATKRWQVALEGLNLAIGSALLPALTDLANALTPIINKVGDLAERYPVLTRVIVGAAVGLVGLRIAAFAAQFAFLWMKGGALAAAALGLRTIAFAARGAAAAFHLLKIAIIGTGIGAVLVGIAMAGMWITNNWKGIGAMFSAFGAAFQEALGPTRATLEPVIEGLGTLWSKVSGLLGPIDETGKKWTAWGQAAGQALGEAVKWAVDLGTKIAGALADPMGTLNGWIASIRQWAAQITQAILDWHARQVASLAEMAGEWAAAGAKWGQALWDGIKAKIDAMVAWFTGLPGRIMAAIGSIDIGSLIKWPAMPSWLGGAKPGPSPAVAGARAAGGPVRGGKAYLVGERGPEIVHFGQSGAVIDAMRSARLLRNAALASAAFAATPAAAAPAAGQGGVHLGGVTFHIQAAPGQSPEAIADAVERRLSAKLASLSRGAFSDGAA